MALHGSLPLRLLLRHGGCRVGALRNRRCFGGRGRPVSRARPTYAMQHLARAVDGGLHYAVGGHRPGNAVGGLCLFGLRFGTSVAAALQRLGGLRLHRLGHARVGLLVAAAADHRQGQ